MVPLREHRHRHQDRARWWWRGACVQRIRYCIPITHAHAHNTSLFLSTLQYDVASAGAFRRALRVTSATSDRGDPTSDRSPNLVNFQYEIHPHRPPTQTFPRARDLPRAPRFVARPAVSTVTTANMSTAVWTRHAHSNGRCWCEFRVTWRYTSCFDETLGDSLNSVPSTTFDNPNLGEVVPN